MPLEDIDTHMGTQQRARLDLGDGIYTEDGTKVGTIRGFDDSGFYVAISPEIDAPTPEHRSTGGAGEADLMWRCWQCGEMGRIIDIPDSCPSCGAGSEELYYWSED